MTCLWKCLYLTVLQKEEIDFLYDTIGNQIRILRKKSGFSQGELASKLKRSRTTIVNIENGRQHPPIHMLIELARVLNVPLSKILDDDMFKDFDNRSKLNQIKKQLKKIVLEDTDQEKAFAFIKQTIGKK